MNYIKRLESIISERGERLEHIAHQVEWLRQHLHSDKFKGDDNGERKDWIAVSDVLCWIETVR
jgi:hypothetical protein